MFVFFSRIGRGMFVRFLQDYLYYVRLCLGCVVVCSCVLLGVIVLCVVWSLGLLVVCSCCVL